MSLTRIPWGGVYAIENTVNGRIYVGSSINVTKRLAQHARALKQGLGPNALLRADLKLHGPDAFQFHILERASHTNEFQIRALENKWARRLGAHNPTTGYNVAPIQQAKTPEQIAALRSRIRVLGGADARIRNAQTKANQFAQQMDGPR